MQKAAKTVDRETYVRNYLKEIDEVINKGPYKDTWESLCDYRPPYWYSAAKFGIFIHWGIYSVPAYGSEWYSRFMYQEDRPEYAYHREKFGPQNEFGYKELIPLFRGEKFDAEEWISLFKRAGARYVVPVAEHHDGFMMYDSNLSPFTAVNMGPCRDVLGELKEACKHNGLIMGASHHRAEHYWFMEGARLCGDVNDPDFEEYYGPAMPSPEDWEGYEETPQLIAHMQDWLVRCCELVDRYRPKLIYFDWWIELPAFKPYLRKFAAYYYNRAFKWGVPVAIDYKHDSFALGSAVFDVERGQLSAISPRLWQCDTAVGCNSWGYIENNVYKKAESIVCDLVDVVSKNGCMLLNVGPKADGTIAKEEKEVLEEIGNWMDANGEAIYDTTFWRIYGEGPTEIPEGYMTDTARGEYTHEDIRFTYKKGVIYAFVMKWTGQPVHIRALRKGSPHFKGQITSISVLGFNRSVMYTIDDEALKIQPLSGIKSDFPVTFKIQLL